MISSCSLPGQSTRNVKRVSITIRQAAQSDLEGLVPLCVEYCNSDGHTVNDDLIRSGVAGLLNDSSNGFMLVACDEQGTLVGYAAVSTGWSIEIGGADYVLDELFVQRQGEGIGRQLVVAVEHRCVELGVRRIFLETEKENERARSLYRRLGFAEDDSVWMSKEL